MELEPSSTDEVSGGVENRDGHRGWAFPALLAVVLLGMAWIVRDGPDAGDQTPAPSGQAADWTPAPEGETVGLRIDYGNGAEKRFAALAWHEGMTIGDLMRLARRFRPGLVYTQQGAGAAGLLTSIDGVGPAPGVDRYWQYEVNGRRGEVSFCIHPLRAGDNVLWTFAPEE